MIAAAGAQNLRPAFFDAQRRSIAFARDWHNSAVTARLRDAFGGAENAEAVIRRARLLLADTGWLHDLVERMVGALADDPLFEPPLPVRRSGASVSIVLFESSAASVSATVVDAVAIAARGLPDAVTVPGRAVVTAYLRAGGARLLRWDAGPAPAEFQAANAPPARPIAPLRLDDGMVVEHDGRRRAQLLADVRGDVVSVTIAARCGQAPLAREYRRSDGALLRVSALDVADSRAALLLTLLRETGRRDAGACFERVTRHPAFHLRWEAMREWLALDALAALPRLREMADDDPHPEIRVAAAAMRQCLENKLGAMPCHA
ncbi:hypothetical protein [Stakelama marina]|uniref:Uncharacterized protein n=1 Tax=Stakelama marina TaxID=2826939 RepID=A0A8T4IFJ1_9SPHN|nr:hypothetical protein [Stakelama marina]MBR0552832.1 hypothetical protein [Stakelama marina]